MRAIGWGFRLAWGWGSAAGFVRHAAWDGGCGAAFREATVSSVCGMLQCGMGARPRHEGKPRAPSKRSGSGGGSSLIDELLQAGGVHFLGPFVALPGSGETVEEEEEEADANDAEREKDQIDEEEDDAGSDFSAIEGSQPREEEAHQRGEAWRFGVRLV